MTIPVVLEVATLLTAVGTDLKYQTGRDKPSPYNPQ